MNVDYQVIKNITIVGSGALATFYAYKLSKVYDVYIFSSWEESKKALSNEVTFINEGKEEKNNSRIFPNNEEAFFKTDLTIWLTKLNRNKKVLEKYSALGASGEVLILQNGIGQIPDFKEMLSDCIVYEGITSQGAKLIKPAVVEDTGSGAVYGPENKRLKSVFEKANLTYIAVENIAVEKLRKLAVNLSLNPVAAVYNQVNGDLIKGAPLETLKEIICEIFPFFRERKIFKSIEEMTCFIIEVAIKTDQNINSMLSDVRSNRPTEIDQLYAPVLKEIHSEKLLSVIQRVKDLF